MLTDVEVGAVKQNVNFYIKQAIAELHEGFRNLEECPLRSFNNKKSELRNTLVDTLNALNEKIQMQL